MKTMLYIGATLMVGASIYGFVDYKQTHNKKEFKEMYSEKKTVVPVTAPVKEEIRVTEPEKTAVVAVKTKTTKKKVVSKKETIDPVAPIAEEEKMVTTEKVLIDEPLTQPEPSKEGSVKATKKKKVRKEFFSRGRMPEEEIVIQPVKKESKESKKIESKQL